MATPQSVVDESASLPPGGGFNAIPDSESEQSQTDTSSTESSVVETDASVQQAEVEARQHGWVSKDEWVADGKDPSRWRPAPDFLDVRHNVLSITRDENQKLRGKLAALETKLALREKAEREAQLRFTGDSLQEELRRARDEGDTAKEAEVTRKLVDHGIEVKTSTVKAAAPQVDPELQQAFVNFGNSNLWLRNDVDLRTDFMIELKRIAEVSPEMDMATALTQAKRRVVRDNPTKFNNGRRTPAMAETGGTGGGGDTSGRTWTNLLPEVRAIAERDIAAKKYTKEDFLAGCEAEHFKR